MGRRAILLDLRKRARTTNYRICRLGGVRYLRVLYSGVSCRESIDFPLIRSKCTDIFLVAPVSSAQLSYWHIRLYSSFFRKFLPVRYSLCVIISDFLIFKLIWLR